MLPQTIETGTHLPIPMNWGIQGTVHLILQFLLGEVEPPLSWQDWVSYKAFQKHVKLMSRQFRAAFQAAG